MSPNDEASSPVSSDSEGSRPRPVAPLPGPPRPGPAGPTEQRRPDLDAQDEGQVGQPPTPDVESPGALDAAGRYDAAGGLDEERAAGMAAGSADDGVEESGSDAGREGDASTVANGAPAQYSGPSAGVEAEQPAGPDDPSETGESGVAVTGAVPRIEPSVESGVAVTGAVPRIEPSGESGVAVAGAPFIAAHEADGPGPVPLGTGIVGAADPGPTAFTTQPDDDGSDGDDRIEERDEPAGRSESVEDSKAAVGSGRFAERLATIEGLRSRPLAEHAEAYLQLHAELQAALAEIDGA